MKKLLLSITVAGLFALAASSVAGACWWWGYQPETPAMLKK